MPVMNPREAVNPIYPTANLWVKHRWQTGEDNSLPPQQTPREAVMHLLDTRDLIDELDELNARREDEDNIDPLDEDEINRIKAIEQLVDEIGDEEASDGVVLIPEDEFVEYAEELAESIALAGRDAPWPVRHIDWNAAADELRDDYSSVTFDGVEYLYRS